MKLRHESSLASRRKSTRDPEPERQAVMPMGVVIRVSPGVTRWARWNHKVVGVLPGCGDAHWKEIRRDGDVADYHAGTLPLEIYRSDTEAYLHGLSARTPSLFVVMRQGLSERNDDTPDLDLILVTASPFEAQDYMDSGEEIVEPVPMPPAVVAWIRDFSEFHHKEEVFYKRQRDKVRVDLKQDGIGDSRIRQTTDVYRAPGRIPRGTLSSMTGETVH